jgi:GNAT superfamily N-acetyltransferase
MKRPPGRQRRVFVAEEHELSPTQAAEMLELQKNCFQDIPSHELEEDFDRPSVARVLAYEEVDLVGCAQVFRRFVDYQGSRVDLGGFGGVCTRADRRRQGIGTEVCLAAMDYLRRRRCEVAFLAVGSSAGTHRFYERFGFRLLARPFVYANSKGVPKQADGGMIAPLCSSDVYERVMKGETSFALTPERGYW